MISISINADGMTRPIIKEVKDIPEFLTLLETITEHFRKFKTLRQIRKDN